MNDAKLESLTDIDMYLFIEKSIRGGVSMIPNRYEKANNPVVPHYNASLPTNYLIDLDINNFYGKSLSDPLPNSDFKWLTAQEIEQFHGSSVNDDSDIGYILRVDLEYPDFLHDLHSDYPLALERMCITKKMLFPYSSYLQTELDLELDFVDKRYLF